MKFISIFIASLLLLGICCADNNSLITELMNIISVNADEEQTLPSGLKYVVYDNYIAIKAVGDTSETAEIPAEIEGLPVTQIIGTDELISNNLKSITIPYSVTEISSNAFVNSTGLQSILVDEKNENYSSCDGVLFNKDKTELICYPGSKNDKVYTVPDSVERICSNSFMSCEKIEKINIISHISVDDNAFLDCKNLTDIYYFGTENEWQEESISDIGNEYFLNANVHFLEKFEINETESEQSEASENSEEGMKSAEPVIYKVILPTSINMGYIVDPQGMATLEVGEEADLEELKEKGGNIYSDGKVDIINKSSVDIVVTSTITADDHAGAKCVDNIEDAATASVMLALVPSPMEEASSTGYALINKTVKVPVILGKAEYEAVEAQNGDISYELKENSVGGSVSFSLAGKCTQTDDWINEDGTPVDVPVLSVVFSISVASETEIAKLNNGEKYFVDAEGLTVVEDLAVNVDDNDTDEQ